MHPAVLVRPDFSRDLIGSVCNAGSRALWCLTTLPGKLPADVMSVIRTQPFHDSEIQ